MKVLKCIIVDDEPIAREILESYVSKIDYLKLVAQCTNALDAIKILNEQNIDIMFLDIKMPTLSGLEMLKTLQKSPNVILTTAYSEFAAQSYEFDVKDYLLKPISFERFLKAVNKVSQKTTPTKDSEKNTNNFFFFKSDKKIYKYYLHEIAYFEGYGNYVKVHSLNKKTILILDKLKDIEGKFTEHNFIRIHKSYIVNISLVNEISGNRIYINQQEIPIGLSYKDDFWEKLKEK